MERFPPENRYPQDTAEQLAGDGAFFGVDMMQSPERLAPGFLAYMENCVCVDGDCRLRPGAFIMPWASINLKQPGPSRADWSAAVEYDAGDEVLQFAEDPGGPSN